MGDPKKIRKKFKKPMHPWQKGRIDLEKELSKKYGLKNKQEIWKMDSILKNFKDQIKKLSSLDTPQSRKEQKQLMDRIVKLGFIKQEAGVDGILGLELENMLERRLQTLVIKKGFARSMKQARQFITHKHVTIGNKKVTAPSYLVTLQEESLVGFSGTSTLHNADHPERIQEELSKTTITRKPKTQEQKDKEALKEVPEKAADKEVQEIIEKEAPEKKEVKAEKVEEKTKKKEVKPAEPKTEEKTDEKVKEKKGEVKAEKEEDKVAASSVSAGEDKK
ncbi:MAG: 30S ribosomal protein S4 [archaeon]